jgi:mannitol/fructose-specific phosphotransferase system IIA component (Ntr-type)
MMRASKLVGLFEDRFFIPDLVSETKEDILEELLQPLVDAGEIRRKDLVLATLHKRETLGSTGIGKGVAIPHCRTIVASKLYIVIGISQKGIPFDGVDKKKVNLLFLIIAPPQDKANLYLSILGKVVEMVRDAKIRRGLMRATDLSSFIQVIRGI